MEKTLEHILFCDLIHVNKHIALDGFPFGSACVVAYFIKKCTLPMKVISDNYSHLPATVKSSGYIYNKEKVINNFGKVYFENDFDFRGAIH